MIVRRTVLAILAIFLLAGAIQPPALSENYASVFSDLVTDSKTVQANGCIVGISIANGSLRAHVSCPDYSADDVTIPAGHTYYYHNVLRIFVDSVNGNSAYVAIDKTDFAAQASTGTNAYCELPAQTALGGDVVSFPLVIHNNERADHVYSLSAFSDVSWKTWFDYGGKGIYKINVPASQSKTIDLKVQTWGNTSVGEKKVVAYVDNIRLEVYVKITNANQSADVSAKVSSKIAYIGDKVTYDIGIKNLQAGENHYKLAVTGLPDNWYARFKETAASAQEIDEAVVPAASTKDLVLEVAPPYSVAPGDYGLTAIVTGPDGLNMYKNLTLTLKSGGGMSVRTPKLAYDAAPGQTFSINLYVSNDGQGTALTNVYVETKAPDGWIVQVAPNQTNSIKAGDTQTFTLSVQPPGNIVASDYELNAVVKSDQAQSAKDFRITVKADSIIPYLGGGIIVLVLVGLVVMYRKYGRR